MKYSEFNKLSKEEKAKVKSKDVPVANKIMGSVLLLSIAVFMIFMVKACFFSTPDDKELVDVNMAVVIHKDFVKTHLKSPSTASFGEYQTSTSFPRTVIIKSFVDSQNGFGAVIRTNYTMELTFHGGEKSDQKNWTEDKFESY